MAIKMNAKSKTLLTVLLVGSLCSLRASDMVEKEPKRLQITAATEQILDAIADLSTSGQSSGIQGTGFDTSTDSLVNISNNTTSVPLATNAQAVDILQGSAVAGTVIAGGTTFTADTNDLTSISLALSAIEGTGFATGTDSLKIVSDNQAAAAQNIALSQVMAAASNTAINLPVATTDGTGATFNTDMATVFTTLEAAMLAPSNGSIDALNDAIDIAIVSGNALTTVTTTVTFTAATTTTPTVVSVGYTAQAVQAGLQSLKLAVTNWLAFYPA